MYIALLEDDNFITEQVKIYFCTKGHKIDCFSNGEMLIETDKLNRYDILLLDIDTPKINGLEALKYIRDIGLNIPAIFVTAKTDISYIKKGYSIGCNDYVKKPFDIEELELRIEQLCSNKNCNVQISKNLNYNFQNRVLYIDGVDAKLSKKEVLLLEILIKNRGLIISYETLQEFVWNGKNVTEGTVRSFMRLLRDKIKYDIIETHRGVGYMIK